MHVLTFPWKLMFALCPPAGLCNGWPCFVISLMAIGFPVARADSDRILARRTSTR